MLQARPKLNRMPCRCVLKAARSQHWTLRTRCSINCMLASLRHCTTAAGGQQATKQAGNSAAAPVPSASAGPAAPCTATGCSAPPPAAGAAAPGNAPVAPVPEERVVGFAVAAGLATGWAGSCVLVAGVPAAPATQPSGCCYRGDSSFVPLAAHQAGQRVAADVSCSTGYQWMLQGINAAAHLWGWRQG